MKNLQIKKVNQADGQKIMKFFQLLNLVASSPEAFDPRDHFNENDEDYKFMMSFYNVHDSEFEYQNFLTEALSKLGNNFSEVLMGYEALIDAYCDPKNQILKPRENLLSLPANKIAEYYSYTEFLNNSVQHSIAAGSGQKIIHVDANGFCTSGYDLLNSIDKSIYPISSWILDRAVEVPGPPFKSLSNN